MTKRQFMFILFFVILLTVIYSDNDDFELLLGQWYGASNQYYMTYDTLYYFKITKNENDLFTLEYDYLGLETVTGTITKESKTIIMNNKEYTQATRYTFNFITNENELFTFNLRRRHEYSYETTDNIWVCSFISDKFYDYWSFSKKSEIIQKHIPHSRPVIGYINNSGVRFRANYGLSGDIMRNFDFNENVRIIGISPTIEVINGNFEYWYNVVSANGEKGWVYGAYLELDGNVMYSFDKWLPTDPEGR